MVKASKGLRTGTRRKFKGGFRSKFTITPFLRAYSVDERVTIKPNPMALKSMPHSRFIGATGVVKEKRGEAYMVEIKVGNKKKMVTARPEHLMPIKQG